ncbi:MAG: 30S ribosome-binding factor RbfA [Planctomycetes bacterium]|nr:30S ribosome-binding factor RbfA [Planctomycetota bacterium]
MANPRTIARLEARIQERAAYCLQFEVNDPRASFITITRVKLSSDLTSAKVYFSVLGDASDKSKAQHMLDHAAGFIQRQVSRVLEMRRVPRLTFYYDDSAEHAADIAHLIHEARVRDMEINPKLKDEPPVKPTDPKLAEELGMLDDDLAPEFDLSEEEPAEGEAEGEDAEDADDVEDDADADAEPDGPGSKR